MMIAMIFTLVTVGPIETRADESYHYGTLYFKGDGKLYTDYDCTEEFTEGKGTTWNASGNILTLSGFTVEGWDETLHLFSDTTIVLTAGTTNKISSSGYGYYIDKSDPDAYYGDTIIGYNLYAEGNLTIQGKGSLTLERTYNDELQFVKGGDVLRVYGDLTINDGTIELKSAKGSSMLASNCVICKNTVKLTGGNVTTTGSGSKTIDTDKFEMTGGTLNADVSASEFKMTGGTLNATAGDVLWSSYATGLYVGDAVVSGGTITAKAGTASNANGIIVGTSLIISGGTVNAYGGEGTKEYYGMKSYGNITVSGKGKLNLYGNQNASAYEALYVEDDTAVFTISDSAIVTADSSIKTDNTLIVSGSAVLQAKGAITAANGITAPRATGAKETFVSGTTTTLTQAGTDSLVLGIDTVEPFTDVKIASWYADAVKYVYSRGIMNGTTKTTFAPAENITRAQLVVMLWNMEGHPNVTVSTKPYKDVAVNKYYSKAVQWAKNNKIVSGYKNGNFGTGDSITRQDATVILMNYVKYKKLNTTTNGTKYTACTDYKKVSGYAVNAIEWAYERNLIGSNGTLNPKGNITRAEAASMLQRLLLYYKI
jgi:hypothetical protein